MTDKKVKVAVEMRANGDSEAHEQDRAPASGMPDRRPFRDRQRAREMSAKGLAVQAAKKVQQEAMNQDGQGADEDMLAAMRHVASHPRRPGQAETEFRQQLRRWIKSDVRSFMTKLVSLEEARIEAEAKKAAKERENPLSVEEPESDVELRRRMQELLDEVRKGES